MEKTKNEELKFLDPEEIIKQLEVAPGAQIADFGCGTGFFSIAMAKKTGSGGKVFCLDVLPQALESVAGRAEILGLNNIVTQRVNLEKANGSKLESGSLDWVVLKDILFQNKQKDVILKEVYRVLKPGGQVLIAEWDETFQGIGPELKIRIKKENLRKMIEAEKFAFNKEIEAGKFHYAVVFRKS